MSIEIYIDEILVIFLAITAFKAVTMYEFICCCYAEWYL